jgi:hypothetical protein
MSSDPRFVEKALHETAVFPRNFNPQNGNWEESQGPRTKLVFDPITKKLLVKTPEQIQDEELAIDMHGAGFYYYQLPIKACFIVKFCDSWL